MRKSAYNCGCLMLNINFSTWNSWSNIIDSNDLYIDDEIIGIENEPHLTIFYGFLDYPGIETDIKPYIKNYPAKNMKLSIQHISYFETENYDVLMFPVFSPMARELNTILGKNFKSENTYPVYRPHITIAYLKNGCAKNYAGKFLPKPLIKHGSEYKYSGTNGKTIKID